MHLVLTDRVTANNLPIVHFGDVDKNPSFKYVTTLNQCNNPRAHSSFAKPVKEQPRGEMAYRKWVDAR